MSMLKRIMFTSMVVAGCISSVGCAQEKVSDAQLDKIIAQMEKTGKLDAAIDRGIKRYGEAQQAAAEKQREAQAKLAAESAKLARKVDPARDHIYGSPTAQWSYIVYSDLECPFCKRHAGVPEEAAAKIGTDKINVVFRHLPLPFHGDAAKREAVASECVAQQAGNDGFFHFVNAVLNTSQLNGQGLKGGDAEIAKLAAEAGAKDEAKFTSCMQDVKMQERVQEDLADGAKAGVTGTPGNIIRDNATGASVPAHGSLPGGAAALEASIRAVMAGPKK